MFLKEMLLSNLLTCVLHFTPVSGSGTIVFEEKCCGNELLLSSFALGYSRNNQTGEKGRGGGSLRTQLLFEIKAWNFKVFCFTPGIPDKTKLHSWKFRKIVLHLWKTPRTKIKIPGNSTRFFLDQAWKFHFVFN